MSRAKIENLEEEIRNKLSELQSLALKTNTPASFSINDKTYEVYLPDYEDEDMNEYLQQEYGIVPGEWISSSNRC